MVGVVEGRSATVGVWGLGFTIGFGGLPRFFGSGLGAGSFLGLPRVLVSG